MLDPGQLYPVPIEKHPQPDLGTTDGVTLRRIFAFIVDSLLLGIVGLPFTVAATMVGDAVSLLLFGVYILFALVYALLLEGMVGYTPGKYLLGLVVVKSDGSNCTISASLLRNLAWLIDSLPTLNLVAIVSIYVTDADQRVGDIIADTVVVRQR